MQAGKFMPRCPAGTSLDACAAGTARCRHRAPTTAALCHHIANCASTSRRDQYHLAQQPSPAESRSRSFATRVRARCRRKRRRLSTDLQLAEPPGSHGAPAVPRASAGRHRRRRRNRTPLHAPLKRPAHPLCQPPGRALPLQRDIRAVGGPAVSCGQARAPVLLSRSQAYCFPLAPLPCRRCYLQHGLALPPGGTVLDMGANIGLFSMFAAEQLGPEVRAGPLLGARAWCIPAAARRGLPAPNRLGTGIALRCSC